MTDANSYTLNKSKRVKRITMINMMRAEVKLECHIGQTNEIVIVARPKGDVIE